MTTRFEWRNGAFYDISMAAEKAQRPDPCPKHTEGLKTLGVIPAWWSGKSCRRRRGEERVTAICE